MAYNNTYGVQVFNRSYYEYALDQWEKPDGIKDKIVKCRELVAKSDPQDHGDIEKVNAACTDAQHTSHQVLTRHFFNLSTVGISFDEDIPEGPPYAIGKSKRAFTDG